MRILVTGSRNWTDEEAIYDRLAGAISEVAIDHPAEEITIVVGDCPTGADKYASLWANAVGASLMKYLAAWGAHGSAAGPARNQRMVNDGADICLAFPLGESRGTRDCMRRAKAAGIPVINCAEVNA